MIIIINYYYLRTASSALELSTSGPYEDTLLGPFQAIYEKGWKLGPWIPRIKTFKLGQRQLLKTLKTRCFFLFFSKGCWSLVFGQLPSVRKRPLFGNVIIHSHIIQLFFLNGLKPRVGGQATVSSIGPSESRAEQLRLEGNFRSRLVVKLWRFESAFWAMLFCVQKRDTKKQLKIGHRKSSWTRTKLRYEDSVAKFCVCVCVFGPKVGCQIIFQSFVILDFRDSPRMKSYHASKPLHKLLFRMRGARCKNVTQVMAWEKGSSQLQDLWKTGTDGRAGPAGLLTKRNLGQCVAWKRSETPNVWRQMHGRFWIHCMLEPKKIQKSQESFFFFFFFPMIKRYQKAVSLYQQPGCVPCDKLCESTSNWC